MGCCDKNITKNNGNDSTREYPEDIDACCHIQGRRCFCLPYDDAWMVTAQVLSIVAVGVAWVWWPCFIVSTAGMVLLQIAWCCRQNKGTLLTSAVVAVLAALAQLGLGIYLLKVWKQYTECEIFNLYTWKFDDDDFLHFLESDIDDDNGFFFDFYDEMQEDHCNEKGWATVSFVCTALWLAAAVCILRFVFGGRHARWEAKHGNGGAANTTNRDSNNNDSNNITTNNNDMVESGAIPIATAEAELEAEPVEVVAMTHDDKVDEA